MNREPLYAALFARLAAIPGLKTASRRLRHWSDVGASEQPALFLAQKSETAQTVTGQPTRWALTADVYLYVNTPAPQSPGQAMNPLLDAIEAALAPDSPARNANTLGGLAQYCRIEGAIETDEGTLGDQAVAIVPIQILAT